MFRCKECQTEYEVKPDYCDCGNDTFEEIVPQVVKHEPKVENKLQKEKPVKVVKTERLESKKTVKVESSFKKFFDPVSTTIFLICLVLSFVVIFFVGNPEEVTETPKKVEKNIVSTNIPSINSIWNNALPKVEQKQPVQPQPVINTVPNKVVQPVKISIPISKPVQNITKKVDTKKTIQKQTATTKKQTTKQTVVATPVKTTTTKQSTAATQPKTTTVSATTKPVTTQTAQTVPTTKPTQTISQPQTTVQPKVTQTVTPTVNKQELYNYKVSLRNKIASKIDFASVIGDGTCVISFTISGSGTLENRKFAKQSDNFTLNDVVYNAMMKTPSYNPPPLGYNREVMKLTVKMYNGSFEVSLN